MQNINDEWLKRRKEILENIKKFQAKKDRVKTATQLVYMHNAIHESMFGWANSLNGWIALELTKKIKVSNVPLDTSLSDTEMKEVHEKFKELSMKFIEFDIEVTGLINKKIHKMQQKQPQHAFEISDTLKDMIV